jgi:hypothetical protein
MKLCSRCLKNKDYSDFCKDSKSKDGLQSQCKPCKVISVAKHRKENPDYWKKFYSKEKALDKYYKHRLLFNISRRIRHSLSGNKNNVSWQHIVNFTLLDLKLHLESKFVEGMCWENYGTIWHIDHIRPISSFNISSYDCDDFRICWSLDNLQPLFAKDNLSKSNKYAALDF